MGKYLDKKGVKKLWDSCKGLSLPASDVSDWAKAATKPTYTWEEILNKPTISSEVTESTVSGWGFTKNAGTVTRVAMTVPTGFSVSGSPVTGNGTLGISFASGYSLPTTAKQNNWDTAYGWGDHAVAGYLKSITKADVEGVLTGNITSHTHNYLSSVPKATTTALGGVIASNVLSSAVTLTSANGATASRYYGVQVDSTGKAFVNVPWTDTPYTLTKAAVENVLKGNITSHTHDQYISATGKSTQYIKGDGSISDTLIKFPETPFHATEDTFYAADYAINSVSDNSWIGVGNQYFKFEVEAQPTNPNYDRTIISFPIDWSPAFGLPIIIEANLQEDDSRTSKKMAFIIEGMQTKNTDFLDEFTITESGFYMIILNGNPGDVSTYSVKIAKLSGSSSSSGSSGTPSLSSSGNTISVSIDGKTSNALTVPYATTATNLASAPSLAADGEGMKITVTAGGKKSAAFEVPYAGWTSYALESVNSTKLGGVDASNFVRFDKDIHNNATKIPLPYSFPTAIDRSYPVQLDETNQLSANVPWRSFFSNAVNIIKGDCAKGLNYIFGNSADGVTEYTDPAYASPFDNCSVYIPNGDYIAHYFDRYATDKVTMPTFNDTLRLRISVYARLLNAESGRNISIYPLHSDSIVTPLDESSVKLLSTDWRYYYCDFSISSLDWNSGDNFAAVWGYNRGNTTNKLLITAPKIEIVSSTGVAIHSLDFGELISTESQMELQQGGLLNTNETSSLPKGKGELLSSKNITIESNKQYYNEDEGRIVSEYIGFDNYGANATIISKYPLVFEGDNVLIPSNIPDAEYLMYTVKYMQISSEKYIITVSVEGMNGAMGELIATDVKRSQPSVERNIKDIISQIEELKPDVEGEVKE